MTGSPWPPQCGGLEQPAHEGAGYARLPQHQPGRKSPISPPGPEARGLAGDRAPEGLDLAAGGRAARAQFATPARDPVGWRAHLEQMLSAG